MRGKNKKPVCAYCGTDGKLTIDHVIPISRWREFGIKRRVLNNKSNQVLACVKCNQEKADKPPYQWFDLHPEYKPHFLNHAKFLSDTVRSLINS